MCVSGVIEEKGRENGRDKRTPKNILDLRWETFVDFTTRGSSEVKSTCILRWPRVATSALVSIKAHLVSRIHTQEQDTGCPSLENRGWWVKEIFDDRSTLPTHPVPQTLMYNDYTDCKLLTYLRLFGHLQKMGDFLRLCIFIGGCCDVISRVGCTPNLQDLQCGIPRCCIL